MAPKITDFNSLEEIPLGTLFVQMATKLYGFRKPETSEKELWQMTQMLLATLGEVWHERLSQEFGEEDPAKIKEALRKLVERM